MPAFPNAQNVSLYNCQLVSADQTYVYNVNGPTPMDLLKHHAVFGALHDSAERYDPPKCHPKTRVAVLDNIISWANTKSSRRILWLFGPAGAGKSAIAQTLSEKWSAEGSLAASFYFSRTAVGRNQSMPLVPTLAYQITEAFPTTRCHIEKAIARDGRLFTRTLKEQLKALIITPLNEAYTVPSHEKIVVIDGLDECCVDYPYQDHEAQQREILDAVLLLSESRVPLKVIVASRPELQIRSSFELGLYHHTVRIKLDDSQKPNDDIELFLRSTFNVIRRDRDIEEAWPSDEILQELITKSSGHFVYPSVVIRRLSDPRCDPQEELNIILGLSPPGVNGGNPFSELDSLYLFIMDSIRRDSLPMVMQIFRVLTISGFFLPTTFVGVATFSPIFLSRLLFYTEKQIRSFLIDLHSIIDIPDASHASDKPMTFIHASFSEFLSDPTRSGAYHIDPEIAWLQCTFSLGRHVLLSVTQECLPEGYNLDTMLTYALLSDKCPSSRQLASCLRALFGKDEPGYEAHLATIGMEALMETPPKSEHLTPCCKEAIISYLLKYAVEDREMSNDQKSRAIASLTTLAVFHLHIWNPWRIWTMLRKFAAASRKSSTKLGTPVCTVWEFFNILHVDLPIPPLSSISEAYSRLRVENDTNSLDVD